MERAGATHGLERAAVGRRLSEAEIVESMGLDPSLMQPGETARRFAGEQYRQLFESEFGVDLSKASTAELIDSIQYYCAWSTRHPQRY